MSNEIGIQAADGALKPCPFCGEREHLYPSFDWPGGGKPHSIDCLGCGIDFIPRKGMDVVEAWNRRDPPKDQ